VRFQQKLFLLLYLSFKRHIPSQHLANRNSILIANLRASQQTLKANMCDPYRRSANLEKKTQKMKKDEEKNIFKFKTKKILQKFITFLKGRERFGMSDKL
jgi:hypothetical protein